MSFSLFLVTYYIPGDPARAALGYDASEQMLKTFRMRHGLDRPFIVQYLMYLGRIVRGDLGRSLLTGNPVIKDLARRLPATLELTLASVLIGTVIAIPLGVGAAIRRGKWMDVSIRIPSFLLLATPIFWSGILFQLIFSAKLGLLPFGGRLTELRSLNQITGFVTLDTLLNGNINLFLDALKHLLMPATVLSAMLLAIVTRTVRSSMLEVLNEQYIMVARAKGLAERVVIFKHSLRNAFIPVLTVIGLRFGELLAGAVVTETVFQWPGMGQYAVLAMSRLDFTAIMGFALTVCVLFALVNLVVDLLYSMLDPRVTLL
jgi:peptide/nickel transport system permease protein